MLMCPKHCADANMRRPTNDAAKCGARLPDPNMASIVSARSWRATEFYLRHYSVHLVTRCKDKEFYARGQLV